MIRRPPRSTLSSSSAASDVYKRQYLRQAVEASIGFISDMSMSSLPLDDCPLTSPLVDYLVESTANHSSPMALQYMKRKGTSTTTTAPPTVGHLTKKAMTTLADRVLSGGGAGDVLAAATTTSDPATEDTYDATLPTTTTPMKAASQTQCSKSKVLGSCIGVFSKHLVEQAILGEMTTYTPSTISHRKLLLLPPTTNTTTTSPPLSITMGTMNYSSRFPMGGANVSTVTTTASSTSGFPQLSVLSTTMALSTAGQQRGGDSVRMISSTHVGNQSGHDDEDSSVLDSDTPASGTMPAPLFEFWFTHDECILLSPIVRRVAADMCSVPVSYTHLRAHETPEHLVCRLLLEKKKKKQK
eukprot:TRINITY_DN13259_c0_g1_i6.p1 TRINITY_DN13259_c0_g1~~TRINITY_DN13259_c0_g1_i6.p1  ORF type:complete len:355 (-),score=70.05 TRINITY_DN13259_c0_g1_i6:14-1078(-)